MGKIIFRHLINYGRKTCGSWHLWSCFVGHNFTYNYTQAVVGFSVLCVLVAMNRGGLEFSSYRWLIIHGCVFTKVFLLYGVLYVLLVPPKSTSVLRHSIVYTRLTSLDLYYCFNVYRCLVTPSELLRQASDKVASLRRI